MLIIKLAKKFYQFLESATQYMFDMYMYRKAVLFDKLDAQADDELIRHETNQVLERERHQKMIEREDMRHFTTVADIGKAQAKLAEI